MRVFKEFPKDTNCPICKSNTNEECVLIGIYGTQEGHNIQAQAFHLKCLDLVWSKEQNIIVMKWRG